MKETLRAPLSAEEACRQIEEHIAEYLAGGPNREAEDIKLGEQCGVDVDSIWFLEHLDQIG